MFNIRSIACRFLFAIPALVLATERYAQADNFAWEQNTLSSNWDLAGNWAGTPNQFPDDNTDSALIDGALVTPTLVSNRTIGGLTIHSGSDVRTGDGLNNFSLTVQESLSQNGVTLIEDIGSTLTVWQSLAANDFDTDDLFVNFGGDLILQQGAKVQVDRMLNIGAGGEIRGAGILELGGSNVMINDGVIRASLGGTLRVQRTGAAQIDLNGTFGNGLLAADTDSTLVIDVPGLVPFAGRVTIGQNAEVEINHFFQLANSAGARLDFNGGSGTATLSGNNLSVNGVMNVNSGTAVLADPITFFNSATVTISQGQTLQFDAPASFYNPDSIVNEFGTTLIVNDDVYIGLPGGGTGNFDWDGIGAGAEGHTIVNTGATLYIDVEHLDNAGQEERYSGTITMNSGNIDVQNADGQWEMHGRLEMNNVVDMAPTLGGEEVLILGEVVVGGTGPSWIQASTNFGPSSSVDVQAGAMLRLGEGIIGSQTAINGGSWTGAGVVDVNADLTTVFAATTVNMPNGTFDLDGNSVGDQLVLNAPLTLNVAEMDDDFNNDINDDLRINSLGRLTMNLTDPNANYGIAESLELNGTGGALSSLHLAGSHVQLLGTTSVTGNSAASARVDIGGILNIAAAGSFQIRGGSAEAPSRVYADAVVTGTGDLIVSSTGPGYLRLDHGASVGVELINRGHLEVGDTAGSASVAAYSQAASGTYHVGIDGLAPDTQYDQLTVAGVADLDGTLEVLVNGNGGVYADPVIPGTFDEFELIMAASVTGTFDEFLYGGSPLALSFSGLGQDRFHAGAGLFRVLDYDATELDLLNYRALAGDANGDGFVDGSDFGIWNANKFTEGTDWITGDFNGDGVTDGSDFGIWNANKFTQINLGRPGLGAFQAVPEPSGALLCCLGLLILAARRI